MCARLVELASESEKTSLSIWESLLADGLLKYRQGVFAKSQDNRDDDDKYFQQAQQVLEAAMTDLSGPRDSHRYRKTIARAILAATLSQLGKEVEARDALRDTQREIREFPQAAEQGFVKWGKRTGKIGLIGGPIVAVLWIGLIVAGVAVFSGSFPEGSGAPFQ